MQIVCSYMSKVLKQTHMMMMVVEMMNVSHLKMNSLIYGIYFSTFCINMKVQ